MKKTLTLVVLAGLMLTGCGGSSRRQRQNRRPLLQWLMLSRFQA